MKKRNRILRNRLLVVSILTISFMSTLTAQASWISDLFGSNDVSAKQTSEGSFNVLVASVMGADQGDKELPTLIGNSVAPVNSPVGGVRKALRRNYTVQVSAYNSEVAQTDDSPFITANGTHVRDGIVAANIYDGSGYNIPFNTAIKFKNCGGIDPNKIFTVTDRLNKRYTKNVDIWLESRADAVKFGRRTCQIEVIQ